MSTPGKFVELLEELAGEMPDTAELVEVVMPLRMENWEEALAGHRTVHIQGTEVPLAVASSEHDRMLLLYAHEKAHAGVFCNISTQWRQYSTEETRVYTLARRCGEDEESADQAIQEYRQLDSVERELYRQLLTDRTPRHLALALTQTMTALDT